MILKIGFWERFWQIQAEIFTWVFYFVTATIFMTIIAVLIFTTERAITKYFEKRKEL